MLLENYLVESTFIRSLGRNMENMPGRVIHSYHQLPSVLSCADQVKLEGGQKGIKKLKRRRSPQSTECWKRDWRKTNSIKKFSCLSAFSLLISTHSHRVPVKFVILFNDFCYECILTFTFFQYISMCSCSSVCFTPGCSAYLCAQKKLKAVQQKKKTIKAKPENPYSLILK